MSKSNLDSKPGSKPDQSFESNFIVNFFKAFWDSCWDTSFYRQAYKASWIHIALHTLVLVVFVSFAYVVATYVPLSKNLEVLFDGLPVIEVEDGRASFEEGVELPKIRKFPNPNGDSLYYIVDSGENVEELEERYDMFVIFTEEDVILSDGNQIVETDWGQIENDALMKNFFGYPLKINATNTAKFTAFVAMLVVGLVFLVIVALLIPAFNFIAAFISTIADKWPLDFMNIAKLSFFAATPACLVQIFGCFFLSGTGLVTILILVSWCIQIAYLITGLKQFKDSSKGAKF